MMRLEYTHRSQTSGNLRSGSELTSTRNPKSGRSTPISDMSDVWAIVSLIIEGGNEILTPPRPDLLEGKLFDSIHPCIGPR